MNVRGVGIQPEIMTFRVAIKMKAHPVTTYLQARKAREGSMLCEFSFHEPSRIIILTYWLFLSLASRRQICQNSWQALKTSYSIMTNYITLGHICLNLKAHLTTVRMYIWYKNGSLMLCIWTFHKGCFPDLKSILWKHHLSVSSQIRGTMKLISGCHGDPSGSHDGGHFFIKT